MEMTKADIIKRLTDIKDSSGNCELAHLKEDMLFLDFIKFVSGYDNKVGNLAKLVLKSRQCKFFRGCGDV